MPPTSSRNLVATLRALVASSGAGARAVPGELSRAFRSLRRAPGFVAISVLSFAVAIGLSSAVFSILDTMLHPTVPYEHKSRLFKPRLQHGNQKDMPSVSVRLEAYRAIPDF